MSRESQMIQSFVEQWGDGAFGIGDDGAVLEVPAGEKLVVSSDAAVENIHFTRPSISSQEIGYRAAAAALSDLAAMAARPIGLLFSLILPVSWRDDATAIAEGVGSAAKASGCRVVGGNISSGAELSLTTTVLGSAILPLTRGGARAGDSLYVTGTLGGAAAAVTAWLAGHSPHPEHRKVFVQPTPRIKEALWLAGQGATSTIDISDGLAPDAHHLATASNVVISIDVDLIPVSNGASIEQALAGGEDYELLVTAGALDIDEFKRKFSLPLTRIGSVAKGAPDIRFTRRGAPFEAPAGYDHLEVK